MFPAPSQLLAYALNALLKREEWARERLQRQAGKTVRWALGTSGLALTINSEGYTDVAASSVVPDVVLRLRMEKLDLASLLRGGTLQELAELMHITGDAALAQVAADLARHLRWDAEDELARRVGDIPAARLVAGARAVLNSVSTAGGRLGQNVSEYLAEESAMLAGKPLFQQHCHDVSNLAERVDTLLQQTAALQVRVGYVAARRSS